MVKFDSAKDWILMLGGSRGLGYASTLKLAKHKMNSIIVQRDSRAAFAAHGIRANGLQPGITDIASFRAIPGSEQLLALGRERSPFKRLTQPEDVANAVFLMRQPEASWINGCIISVDGGTHIR